MCLSTNFKFIAYVLIHKPFFKVIKKIILSSNLPFISEYFFVCVVFKLFRRDNKKKKIFYQISQL